MARPVTPTEFEQFAYTRNIRGENYEFLRDQLEENVALRRQLGEEIDREQFIDQLERQIIEGGRNRIAALGEENEALDDELAFRQAEERKMERRREKVRQAAAKSLIKIREQAERERREQEREILRTANALTQLRTRNPRNQNVTVVNTIQGPRPGTPRPKENKRRI
jgi:hypothetical protein